MSKWQQLVAKTASTFEDRVDALKARLGSHRDSERDVVIIPYLGYGTTGRVVLRGRVLRDSGIAEATADDSLWDNVLNMYRRIESDELSGVQIRARFHELEAEAVTDKEGFFSLTFSPEWAGSIDQLWDQVELQLVGEEPVHATGHVLLPPSSARFGVISDVDDTVLQTYATELLRMARLLFLGNAHTRLPFPGVSALYRALQSGAGGTEANPLFYVSSSPWNLYDLLIDFFQLQNIPLGPIFLRDWGISEVELLPTDHHNHKLDAIHNLLEFYPDLPFILIGDSGQQDPEIYSEVVSRYPGRILAVFIRTVTPDRSRQEAIALLQEKVAEARSQLILADDSLAMAEHAVRQGWIDPVILDDIELEMEQNKAAPTPAEALLENEEA
jgi:phosphatidate phosphatase APP1